MSAINAATNTGSNAGTVSGAVSGTANGTANGTASARKLSMEHAAHQFEASLMKELFAPLEQDALSAGDGDENSGSGNALTGFAGEAMARAVSDDGGFGIARQLIRHFEKLANGAP